jgi:hypothetical protein
MANLAGETDRDAKIWNQYVFWARPALDTKTESASGLDISDPRRRLTVKQEAALRAIVFTSFALEYRIKRILEALGLSFRKRDSLGSLLENFRTRIETAMRMDDGKKIRLPSTWPSLEKRLKKINELRNRIAHAKYAEVNHILTERPGRVASRSFNALVDFIQVTNEAIGYDTDRPAVRRKRYRELKVRVS